MHTPGASVSGYTVLLIVQLVFIVVFGVYAKYGDELLPQDDTGLMDDAGGPDGSSVGEQLMDGQNNISAAAAHGQASERHESQHHKASYPHFQDIHVMIFVGFAFLMTFLKRYGYSATGFNLFAGALVIQWALIARGIFDLEHGYINLNLDSLIGADIAAASVLISMGALLGRTTPFQLLFMGLIEIFLFAANEHLQLHYFMITDAGGSIVVHAFGAYFGLAVSAVLRPAKEKNEAGQHEGASYNSDIFAMVGTLFLWIFWPSFNSALLDGADQERAIINTYISLAAATVTTFVFSVFVSHEHKLDMVHIQNSTLAGGVGVGAVCNLLIGPGGAAAVGFFSGLVSVLGYRYLSPIITSKLRIHDTCGVHNLHGMPAILSALFSAAFAGAATLGRYKSSLTATFPAMATSGEHHMFGSDFYGRSATQQACFQLAGIGVTLALAIVGGVITGFLLRSPSVRNLEKEEHHDDSVFWEVPKPEAAHQA